MKTYESQEEEDVRKAIFAQNVKHIQAHNELYKQGKKSYYLGVNQFTDLVNHIIIDYSYLIPLS